MDGGSGGEIRTGGWEPIEWLRAKNFLSEGCRLGAEINSAPVMPSTQIPAKEAARRGARHGAVFVTDFQNSGRGRRDRNWIAVPGADLTFSVILRPNIAPEYAQLLNLAAALAVGGALSDFIGKFRAGAPNNFIGIKWPNDVMVNDKKICGIICESSCAGARLDYAALGIGVNVNGAAPDMPVSCEPDKPRATSVYIESGRLANLPRLLGEILSRLDALAATTESDAGRAELIDMYIKKSLTLGRTVRVITEGGETLGTASGITGGGALEVTDAGGHVSVFNAADVVHARAENTKCAI